MSANLYQLLGPAGCALLVIAFAALYIALKNAIYLHMVWRGFQKKIRSANGNGWEGTFKAEETNPLMAIIRDTVTIHARHSEDIRAEVAYLFHRYFASVNRSLQYLRLISVISPLLGLLGTILGMVGVFRTIAQNTSPDATMLAAGIWEALITTIMGLCVAIPALVFYYYLGLKFKGFRIEAIEYSYRAIESSTGAKTPGPGAEDRAACHA